jgi:hypothetical protein
MKKSRFDLQTETSKILLKIDFFLAQERTIFSIGCDFEIIPGQPLRRPQDDNANTPTVKTTNKITVLTFKI